MRKVIMIAAALLMAACPVACVDSCQSVDGSVQVSSCDDTATETVVDTATVTE